MEQYIQPFINVSKRVFKDFLGATLEAERPYFADKDKVNKEWDISAVIGLTGEALGAVVISMKKDLVLNITDILTGSKHTDIDEETVDAVGEIVNIIAGNVKKELEEELRLVISLPTIVKGKEHSIVWAHGLARVICIPFTIFDGDTFCLSVAIEAQTSKGA